MPLFRVIEQVDRIRPRRCFHCFDVQTFIRLTSRHEKELLVDLSANFLPSIRQGQFDDTVRARFICEGARKKKQGENRCRCSEVGFHFSRQRRIQPPPMVSAPALYGTKKYRVRWKKIGAAKLTESILSNMPP